MHKLFLMIACALTLSACGGITIRYTSDGAHAAAVSAPRVELPLTELPYIVWQSFKGKTKIGPAECRFQLRNQGLWFCQNPDFPNFDPRAGIPNEFVKLVCLPGQVGTEHGLRVVYKCDTQAYPPNDRFQLPHQVVMPYTVWRNMGPSYPVHDFREPLMCRKVSGMELCYNMQSRDANLRTRLLRISEMAPQMRFTLTPVHEPHRRRVFPGYRGEVIPPISSQAPMKRKR